MKRAHKSDRAKYQDQLTRQRIFQRGAAPSPRRITMALDSLDLEGPGVDLACGVEEPAVDEWEAGTRVPTLEQVEALARLTGYSLEFFYRTDPPQITRMVFCGPEGCDIVDNRPLAPVLPLHPPTLF